MAAPAKRQHKEVIGRDSTLLDYLNSVRPSNIPTVDTTTLDYEWWDRFRNGMQEGYELASRLVSPIAKIRSVWALGDGLNFRLRTNMDLERITYTNEQLKEWASTMRSTLSRTVKDLDELADQYIIFNLDGSYSIPSPETVFIKRDRFDYRHILSITVRTIDKDVEIHDIYMSESRVIRVKNLTGETLATPYGDVAPKTTYEFPFDNPLGFIPVACFHNRRSANETNGRVVYAGDILLLNRYDDLATKTIDASAIMGTPIPTWEGVDDIEREKAALEVETGHYELDGTPKTAVDFELNSGMWTTGTFSLKGPGIGFTKDIRDTLKLLFLLILEEHGIPESIWGGEMGQARATSIEQMKTFHAMIEGYRLELEGVFEPDKGRIEGMIGMASIWLRIKAMTDRKIVVDALALDWPSLDQMDAAVMLERVKYLGDTGRLSDETVIHLLDVVENPAEELEKARAEAKERQDAFDAAMASDLEDDPLIDPDTDGEDDDIDDEAA